MLDFETFTFGRVLGNTIDVTNKTDKSQAIEIAIAKQRFFGQSHKQILQQFDDVPFSGSSESPSINSEFQYMCWFLENPATKQLKKKFTIKLAPRATETVIVVIKTTLKTKVNAVELLGSINLRLVS